MLDLYIFLINYHNDTEYFEEKNCCGKGLQFFYTLKFIGIGNHKRTHATKTYSSLELINAKYVYSLITLSTLENDDVNSQFAYPNS
jgi:hypothetical protein